MALLVSNKIRKFLLVVWLGVIGSCQGITKESLPVMMVSAATGELGTAVSKELCSKGYALLLAARNPEKLERLKQNLRDQFPNTPIQTVIIDYEKPELFLDAAKQALENSLSGMIVIPPKPSLPKKGIPKDTEWNKVLAQAFIGPLEMIRCFHNHLKKESSVVVISGLTSIQYLPNYPNTNVIRLAWTGEIKNLMYFFSERKIRINAISPAVILTEFHKKNIEKRALKNHRSYQEQLKEETQKLPLQRYGKPEEVAKIIHFLLSGDSLPLNGINLPIDGGEMVAY